MTKRKAATTDGGYDLAHRELVEFVIPVPKGLKLLSIQQALIRFGDSGLTRDFGSFCYLKREPRAIRAPNRATRVASETFVPARRKVLARIIEEMSEAVRQGGSQRTQYLHAQRFLTFLTWADASYGYDVLQTSAMARDALLAFSDVLRQRSRTGELAVSTASKCQATVSNFLCLVTGDTALSDEVTPIKKRRAGVNGTPPRSDEAVGRQLALDRCLFEGLREVVLRGLPFPYALNVPPFVDQGNNTLWIFPTSGLFRTESEVESRHYEMNAYDFSAGRLRTYEECKNLYATPAMAKSSVAAANERLMLANADHRCSARFALAKISMNAFIDMFLANSGMNWEQVRLLEWAGELAPEQTSQDFSQIKARAGGAEVTFSLTNTFLPRFRRYLELRTWMLEGNTTNLLFFHAVKINNGRGHRLQKLPLASPELLYAHRRILPGMTLLGSREWRSTKTNWHVNNYGTAIAAAVAQSTVRTIETKYAAGTDEQMIRESGEFFSKLSGRLVSRERMAKATPSAVGGCEKYTNPQPYGPDMPFEPNCAQPEGCLFCSEHEVVADETDVRKLLSFRYCIMHTRALSGSKQEWRAMYAPILKRLKQLLGLIASVSKEAEQLVRRIRREVNKQGKLDPYWDLKMSMLEDISGGVL